LVLSTVWLGVPSGTVMMSAIRNLTALSLLQFAAIGHSVVGSAPRIVIAY
jgi:hypothetical protein